MRSRISIDFDRDNYPIIKLEYRHSDDVRDKLVQTFLNGMGTSSNALSITCDNTSDGQGAKTYSIRVVGDGSLVDFCTTQIAQNLNEFPRKSTDDLDFNKMIQGKR